MNAAKSTSELRDSHASSDVFWMQTNVFAASNSRVVSWLQTIVLITSVRKKQRKNKTMCYPQFKSLLRRFLLLSSPIEKHMEVLWAITTRS